MPKILFLGDIVGRPGRSIVIEHLSTLRSRTGADIVVVNAENAAGGAGLTAKIAAELFDAGVDGITLGDHVWDQKDFELQIGSLSAVCRPANLPPQNPGADHLLIEKNGFRLGVFTVIGRNFIAMKGDCPFRTSDAALEKLKGECEAVLVEAHMEASSEKIALGWYLDGRVAAVVGTHTHVPTADGRILPGGTAYLSDAGMTGPYAGVLGRDSKAVLASFLDGRKRRFEVADGDVRMCGCLIEMDAASGRAASFERIEVSADKFSPSAIESESV